MITQTYDFEDIKIWSERKSFKQIKALLLKSDNMFSILIESNLHEGRFDGRIIDDCICCFLSPDTKIIHEDYTPSFLQKIEYFNPYGSKLHSLESIKLFNFNNFKNKLKFINICSSILIFT